MMLLKRFTETFHKRCRSTFTSTSGQSLSWLSCRGVARPRACAAGAGSWVIEVPGEPDSAVRLADHDPDLRAELVRSDGLDRAYVALSCPLGIEALPPDEGRPLLDAWHDGAAALPAEFGAWARPASANPTPRSWPPSSIAASPGPASPQRRWRPSRVSPLRAPCSRCSTHGARRCSCTRPGARHPWRRVARGRRRDPSWWPALTRYVAAMNAAWHAFALYGRPAHPQLRVCFAMLAGLAPLHRERLVARGGGAAPDPYAFLDTSSYGPRAVDAVIRELGVDGSPTDRTGRWYPPRIRLSERPWTWPGCGTAGPRPPPLREPDPRRVPPAGPSRTRASRRRGRGSRRRSRADRTRRCRGTPPACRRRLERRRAPRAARDAGARGRRASRSTRADGGASRPEGRERVPGHVHGRDVAGERGPPRWVVARACSVGARSGQGPGRWTGMHEQRRAAGAEDVEERRAALHARRHHRERLRRPGTALTKPLSRSSPSSSGSGTSPAAGGGPRAAAPPGTPPPPRARRRAAAAASDTEGVPRCQAGSRAQTRRGPRPSDPHELGAPDGSWSARVESRTPAPRVSRCTSPRAGGVLAGARFGAASRGAISGSGQRC